VITRNQVRLSGDAGTICGDLSGGDGTLLYRTVIRGEENRYCLLSAVCCLLFCCLLSALCYLLSALCCLLSAIRCLLVRVCCLVSVPTAHVCLLLQQLTPSSPAYRAKSYGQGKRECWRVIPQATYMVGGNKVKSL
jgi:hypothetical protein